MLLPATQAYPPSSRNLRILRGCHTSWDGVGGFGKDAPSPLGLQSPLNSLGPRSLSLPVAAWWRLQGRSAGDTGKWGPAEWVAWDKTNSRILGETRRNGGLGDCRPKVTLSKYHALPGLLGNSLPESPSPRPEVLVLSFIRAHFLRKMETYPEFLIK